MPFKQKHIHSRLHQHDATDSTAPSSLPIDASTRLPVASSSTSSSSFISAGSQMNNNDQDDDLSTLSADDNDDDSQDPVNSTTIFKNRDAFEAYARVRFAATTQPTSRGAEKKNTPNVISMSCRNARSAQAVDQGTSCTWSMKAQFFDGKDDEEKGWKVVKDVQLHNAACIARASKFGKAAKREIKMEEGDVNEMLGLEGEGEGWAPTSSSAPSKRRRLSKASKSTSSLSNLNNSNKKTTSSTTARRRAKSPDYSKMSFLFDKVYNLRKATVKKEEESEDDLDTSTSGAAHHPQRRGNRITLAHQSKVRVKQEDMDDYDYSPSFYNDHQQRQASISSMRDDTPNPSITIASDGNNAAHAQFISSSSLSPVSASSSAGLGIGSGRGRNVATVSPRSSRSSSLTSLDDLEEDADADSGNEENDASIPLSMQMQANGEARSPSPFSAIFPNERHAYDAIVQRTKDQIGIKNYTSASSPAGARAAREASIDLVAMLETILSSPMPAHKRPSSTHLDMSEDVNGALALAMLSKSPSPAAYEREEGNDSGYGKELDLDLDL